MSTGLVRVDNRLRERVGQVRAAASPSAEAAHDPLAGYYISEAEVDRLLAAPELDLPDVDHDRVAGLVESFGLTPFDTDVVLTCLAPEVDRRFGRLYAYLHDDVTRRAPSVDLVLTLWCGDGAARLAGRARLAPGAPLRRHDIMRLDEGGEPRPASMLECALRLDQRVTRHLLDDDDPDSRLAGVIVRSPGGRDSPLDGITRSQLGRADDLVALLSRTGHDVVVHLAGAAGSGRHAIAAEFSRATGRALLVVRCDALARQTDARCAELVGLVAREARLRGAATYWRDADAFEAGDRLDAFADTLADVPGPVFLGGAGDWDGPEPAGRPFVRLALDRPDAAARHRIWSGLLGPPSGEVALSAEDATSPVDNVVTRSRDAVSPMGDVAASPGGLALPLDDSDPPDIAALAAAFRFTPGQIRDAVATAGILAVTRDPRDPKLRQADLEKACRLRSGRGLTRLARHVVTPYGWDDLVLPPARLRQLRELADQVRHRGLVHDTWDFGRVVAPAGGLTVLFAGPPGTGKTMAASVLANALGVDLYAIDLATTVSKYIGETEKNLARVFDAAADSNAILFFDEADALFGRRTQVRDAHDRYANIETSYLLQRIETHPGLVVLATNLRKNMDEAFVRRFRATLEFPAPGEAERLRIWERIWPAAAPRAADVDLAALARAIDLSGGHIRNIVLGGAFLAAADGGVITMAHLLRATRGEYEKLGKIISPGDLAAVAPRHDQGRGAHAHDDS
ncbi:AAA family ATPase [Frankia sp. CNm7]|uniref:AAA family ATPase n=1 Tax=Frankia nepalensis TaxID=1836974 RepID=A0A937RPU6_9ACTN|nr:AAA family ATPase [Frankia nepalensis]MBL7495712.1 AAA family ATPase [Frankia nepalensis]MBL7508986.1 AAA family ATPase [Frankia nepalensis]MBL7520831.1 AAA family ATPase [Frankia nepalensis]MBL7629786.1 AAA family ATPase [Frankia nepalensis]